MLNEYVISEDGRLLKRFAETEWVEDPSDELLGGHYVVKDEWEGVIEHHGDIRIYDMFDRLWVEWEIRFTHGKVESVTRVMEQENG